MGIYEQMDEIVYILINEAMPDYIKIGRTTNLKARLKGLSRTSVPVPFVCFSAKKVKKALSVERKLHAAYAKDRVDRGAGQEFFKVPAEQVAAALDLVNGLDVTPREDVVMTQQEKNALDEIRSRRAPFKFSMVKIKPGSVLNFYLDEKIKCIVVDNKKVKFRGKNLSLTQASKIVLENKDIHWKAVSGPGVWMYKGETLHRRRLRMEGA